MRGPPAKAPASNRAGLAAVLLEEVVLPGEGHVLQVRWEGERVALAELPDAQPEIVLIPREAMYREREELICVLAAVDGMDRDDEGSVTAARCMALRRVVVPRPTRTDGLILVAPSNLPPAPEPDQAELERLERLRRRLSRRRGIRLEMGLEPDQLIDRMARELDAGHESRLELLCATDWRERLCLVEKLSRSPRGPRALGRLPRASVDRSYRTKLATLPEDVRQAVEQERSGEWGGHRAESREAVACTLELVWQAPPPAEVSLDWAEAALDAGHFGMEAAKRSLLDLAVTVEWQRRRGQTASAGRCLCLVGPPGTGKTTLLLGLAEAVGRHVEVLPLGGADDVSLAGADRTYLRSRPGGVVRRLRAAHRHPSELVFVLDEIDKVSRNSVHSAVPVLLELLDPAQSRHFRDRFLDSLRIDLSSALFVATANEAAAIPAPLLDRLQCVEVRPYTLAEQLSIARSWLWPKLCHDLGVTDQVLVETPALHSLVYEHPQSPGCRQLEQRLRVVLSRALAAHMRTGKAVVVDAATAREWVPPASRAAIGFNPGIPGLMVLPGGKQVTSTPSRDQPPAPLKHARAKRPAEDPLTVQKGTDLWHR